MSYGGGLHVRFWDALSGIAGGQAFTVTEPRPSGSGFPKNF